MLRLFLVDHEVEPDHQQYPEWILYKDLRSTWLAHEEIPRKKDVDARVAAGSRAVIVLLWRAEGQSRPLYLGKSGTPAAITRWPRPRLCRRRRRPRHRLRSAGAAAGGAGTAAPGR